MTRALSRRRKHVPQRTCIACQRSGAKGELLRLVRTTDGRVLIDATGKLPGRGAYLCRRPECVEKGGTKKIIERALKMKISEEALECLRRQLQSALLHPVPDERDEPAEVQRVPSHAGNGSGPRGGVA